MFTSRNDHADLFGTWRLCGSTAVTELQNIAKVHLRESFHAALTVATALCVQADLAVSVRLQLVERTARHLAAPGAEGRAVATFLALLAQQQDLEEILSEKILRRIVAVGPTVFVEALG